MRWSEEQQALREGVARYGEALSDGHRERDRDARFDPDKWKLIAGSGLFGLPFGEEHGGLGQSLLTTMYVLEGLGEACRDGGLSFSITSHMVSTGVPVQRFGSAALKERYLPGVCTGATIGAHAISEPEAGSDALAMTTTATRDGDVFRLRGSKSFVSNAPIADLIVVYARTHPGGGPLGITAFLVERGTPGLTVGPSIPKLGLRSSPFAEVFLDDCEVPADRVIGRVGGGFRVLDHVMKREILCSFIVNIGEAEHRLARVVEYARTRRQFGQPIGKFQSVANRIVDLRIAVDTARMWLYRAGELLDAGQEATTEVAVAKLLASEANLAAALGAVQIFGGNGYTAEYGLEAELRNAVGGTIYSGTSDIQRTRIASMLGL
ncbi:acyl-CoA dehydrogenase family protein [Hamadaea tsunoensis]|uniref:acyl-CoA dehydrogenase family protein n=1 Tax=Hamadaea tsunoensis TaxID=53368 RepID=UPI000428D046|nr:acyl-CoA dehydrogenase family protein [Hamadaea tsunoensis]